MEEKDDTIKLMVDKHQEYCDKISKLEDDLRESQVSNERHLEKIGEQTKKLQDAFENYKKLQGEVQNLR